MVPHPFLFLAVPFIALLFPLGCSSSQGIFLQHISPIALELLLVSSKCIAYPMSCQDSVKIPGLLHDISKCSLRALSLGTKSEFWPHLFSHAKLFSLVLLNPFLVTCWVVWPRSAPQEAVRQVWVCCASHTICWPVPGTCGAAVAALMRQGNGKRNPCGEVHQWNPHLAKPQFPSGLGVD